MASMEDFRSVLSEIESSAEIQALSNKHRTKTKPPTRPPILLSAEHVVAVTSALRESPITNAHVKSCLANATIEDLMESLQWMNGCLVSTRLMMSAAVDKVWGAYHRGLLEHISEMAKVTSSTQASALLALHVMKSLVKINYRQPKETYSHHSTITERDIEILTYITGFLLRRYRHLPEAQALCGTESTGFTAAINRGGLMKPKSECVEIVQAMEAVFRSLPTKSVDRSDFQKTLSEWDLQSKLFQLLEEVETSPENKEQFFMDISELFFTVRAHQKCRQFLEQHIKKTHSKRKSKALRDSI